MQGVMFSVDCVCSRGYLSYSAPILHPSLVRRTAHTTGSLGSGNTTLSQSYLAQHAPGSPVPGRPPAERYRSIHDGTPSTDGAVVCCARRCSRQSAAPPAPIHSTLSQQTRYHLQPQFTIYIRNSAVVSDPTLNTTLPHISPLPYCQLPYTDSTHSPHTGHARRDIPRESPVHRPPMHGPSR